MFDFILNHLVEIIIAILGVGGLGIAIRLIIIKTINKHKTTIAQHNTNYNIVNYKPVTENKTVNVVRNNNMVSFVEDVIFGILIGLILSYMLQWWHKAQ